MKTNHTTRFTNKSHSPLYFKYAIRLVKANHSQMFNTPSPLGLKHSTTPPNINHSKKYFNNSFSNSRSFNKTFTKGKFYKALNSNLIYTQRKVKYLNIKYKDNDLFHKQIYLNKNNAFNTNTKNNLNLLRSAHNSFRYEDVYITPEEFLKKNFTPNEIDVIFKDQSSFNLHNELFKDCKLKICKSLTDIINKEKMSKRINNNNNNKHKTHCVKNKSKQSSPNYLSSCNSSTKYFNSNTVTARSSNNTNRVNKNIIKYANNIQPLVISKPTTPHIKSFTCKSSNKSQFSQLKALLHKQAMYETNRINYYQYKQQKISQF